MSTCLVYFSATGNSLAVTRHLARKIDGAEVIPLTRLLKSDMSLQHECVGVVFPVYMFGLPLIVAEFLRKVTLTPNAYFFAVATFGGLPGRALTLARKIVQARGITFAAGFSVQMPGNYTPLYGAISQEKQKAMFEKEPAAIARIAEAVRSRKTGIREEGPVLVNLLLYTLLYRGGTSQIRAAAKDFWVTEQCVQCGLCQKVCPVANIRLDNGRPSWLHHCEHCMACLQWCPQEAIQYKKRTQGKKRYHHPDIQPQDIMEQQAQT